MIALTFFLVETFDTPRCIKQRFLTLFQLVDIRRNRYIKEFNTSIHMYLLETGRVKQSLMYHSL